MPQLTASHLTLSGGNTEALKWLALVLMTLDHINTFLYDRAFPALYDLGRIAMPVFGFVLACNLARPGALENGVHLRVMKRLALFGLLATPPFVAMVGWLPFNIMFTLLLAAAVMWLMEQGGQPRIIAAAMLFIAGSPLVEFSWFGVLYCLAAWVACKRPGVVAFLSWTAAAASLYMTNGNFWAVAAIPLILAISHARVHMPRLRYVFYGYYPVHLALLWLAGWGP
jgi:hypothetical protein